MAFKICAKCGKQVREIDAQCWNCKSDTFESARTTGTPATVASLNSVATGQPAASQPAPGFWDTVASAAKEAQRKADLKKWGDINAALVCPHCQVKGQVHTLATKRKKGISGAKATGAVLTLGWSLLATGLSRKEYATQAHCDNCQSTWDF